MLLVVFVGLYDSAHQLRFGERVKRIHFAIKPGVWLEFHAYEPSQLVLDAMLHPGRELVGVTGDDHGRSHRNRIIHDKAGPAWGSVIEVGDLFTKTAIILRPSHPNDFGA
jgi:hypothetical protein